MRGRAAAPAPFSLPKGRAEMEAADKRRLHIPATQFLPAIAQGSNALEHIGWAGFFLRLPAAAYHVGTFLPVLPSVYAIAPFQTVPAGILPKDVDDLLHFYHPYDKFNTRIIRVSYDIRILSACQDLEEKMSNFSLRMKELRKERNMKQQELADTFSVKLRTYQGYEYGESYPEAAKLIAIADFFDVSLDYLVGRSDIRVRQ